MSKPFKVYGGPYYRGTAQERAIVAAPSLKAAAQITGLSQYTLNTYWSVTYNTIEIQAATETPGIVLIRRGATYIPL